MANGAAAYGPRPPQGECPVEHVEAMPQSQQKHCPVGQEKDGATMAFIAAAAQEKKRQQEESGEIDPRNLMPRTAEQKPWPGQKMSLPTHRTESVIPKGHFTPDHQKLVPESGSWMYPSEQQFYNAMKRKGWEAREEDMKIVVAIHNAVNDRAWSEVMKWEELHSNECDCPKLVKFMGKPKEMSPKAFLKSSVGFSKPFDRHDWIVDRCGKNVRYIIDFYQGKPSETGEPVSMYLDARPALDSADGVFDRLVRMPFKKLFS